MTNIEPKRTLYFDIETDGLEPTIIHCIVTMDGLGNIRRYNHEELGNVQDGLDALSEAHLLIGQNIIGYDLPAIMKVYPSWATGAAFMDTLVCARLAWPHIKDLDFKRKDNFPKELFGSHSLKAWGVRLGFEKGSYGEDTEDPWARWSMDMEDYCQRDVEVTHRLYQEFLKAEVPEAAVLLEHETHDLMEGMTERGFYFDRQRAEKLYVRLLARKDQLAAELQDLFPPKEIHLKTKVKLKAFNPGSRQQIAERFERFACSGLDDQSPVLPHSLHLRQELLCVRSRDQKRSLVLQLVGGIIELAIGLVQIERGDQFSEWGSELAQGATNIVHSVL